MVDSIISLFRTDFSGRGELGERQQKLNQMLARLARISEEYNVAVFITNQMMADPGAAISFVPDPKKPIGGHVLAHASTTRLSLRKGRNEVRIAKVYDSPDMPEVALIILLRLRQKQHMPLDQGVLRMPRHNILAPSAWNDLIKNHLSLLDATMVQVVNTFAMTCWKHQFPLKYPILGAFEGICRVRIYPITNFG